MKRGNAVTLSCVGAGRVLQHPRFRDCQVLDVFVTEADRYYHLPHCNRRQPGGTMLTAGDAGIRWKPCDECKPPVAKSLVGQ